MIVRALYNDDGTVSIICPVLKSKRTDETAQDWLRRVFNKANPGGLPYDDIDTELNPLPDRRFRNAWAREGAGIEVDITRAKSQVIAELRKVRNKELAETDGLMARANEINSQIEINRLMIRRRNLRNLPQSVGIEAIKTIEELATIYPGKLSAEEYLDLASS